MNPPWSNGSQFQDWEQRNCMRCRHFDFDDADKCPIADTMLVAMAGLRDWTPDDDATVGYPRDKCPYTWDCPSRDTEAAQVARERRELRRAERQMTPSLFGGED